MPIDEGTTLEELAALISQALERAGIAATLSGGGAVTLYSENEYLSYDLDFITSERNEVIAEALSALGFERVPGAREFRHPATQYYAEFPPGPLAFGETVVSHDDSAIIDTPYGPLRIVTPAQAVMDRLAAYLHWNDLQALDQALAVVRRQQIDWERLEEWARQEGLSRDVLDRLKDASHD